MTYSRTSERCDRVSLVRYFMVAGCILVFGSNLDDYCLEDCDCISTGYLCILITILDIICVVRPICGL